VHGSAELDGPGHAERIDCPRLGNDGRLQASRMEKRRLTEIIAPRIEETLEIVSKRLGQSALKKVLPRRGVLTGGASQLPGMRETAARLLDMPVRLGRPIAADRLGETYASPAFSTASGLLTYMLAGLPNALEGSRFGEFSGKYVEDTIVNKAFFWIKENF